MKLKCYIYRRMIGIILLLSVLFGFLPGKVSALVGERLRVGLYFGSNALPTANLANKVGQGYRLGYFNSGCEFVTLGYTDVEKITICKDQNLYLSGGTYYETKLASGASLIGAYHLQTSKQYPSFDEALAASAAYPYGFPAAIDGAYVVRFEFFSSASNALADASKYDGVYVVGGSQTCYTVTDTQSGRILFEYDDSGDQCLGVMPDRSGTVTAQTWFKGYPYYGGFRFERKSGNDLTVVNILSLDAYVEGVLANEFICSGTLESVKAGAICVRTYASSTSKHASSGFDICSTDDCQVYRGVYSGDYCDRIVQAVRETSGLCMYYNDSPIQALYFAADGGATESAVNAWGNEYPYLIGKPDPYEAELDFGAKSWTYTVTPSEVQSMLQKLGYSAGTVVSMKVTETTDMGNVNQLVITDSNGETFTFDHDNVRILRNLPNVKYFSRRFTITENGAGDSASGFSVYDGTSTTTFDKIHVMTANGIQTVVGPHDVITESGTTSMGFTGGQASTTASSGWTISGGGYGHNIGLSQWGAYAMGKKGLTCNDILQFYYTGVTIR